MLRCPQLIEPRCWVCWTGRTSSAVQRRNQSLGNPSTPLGQIKEYDLVVIDRDIPVNHKETKQPILLRKGQVGTVVMDFEGEAFLIDFADKKGTTYAMETVPAEHLIPLLYNPVALQVSS